MAASQIDFLENLLPSEFTIAKSAPNIFGNLLAMPGATLLLNCPTFLGQHQRAQTGRREAQCFSASLRLVTDHLLEAKRRNVARAILETQLKLPAGTPPTLVGLPLERVTVIMGGEAFVDIHRLNIQRLDWR